MDAKHRFPVTFQMKLSRSVILTAIVVVVLLAAAPHSIRRLIQTGNAYLFTRDFFYDMFARLSGPGRLRFIIQPTVAVLFGARDGAKDARIGSPPFLRVLVTHGNTRRESLKKAFLSIRDLILVAILLDIISQYLIFHVIHPGAALLLGPVLIGIPYIVSRDWASRILLRRGRRTLDSSDFGPSRHDRPR